jgi:hypothetical protein
MLVRNRELNRHKAPTRPGSTASPDRLYLSKAFARYEHQDRCFATPDLIRGPAFLLCSLADFRSNKPDTGSSPV